MSQPTPYSTVTLPTGRGSLLGRIGQSLARANRKRDYLFALLYIDLDRFKLINESLGHQVGEMLLEEISRRLAECVRGCDAVGRMGGDDYGVIVDDMHHPGDAMRVAERIQTKLRLPVQLGTLEAIISASIGIAYSSSHYKCPEDLLRDAEIAMYRAREQGTGRWEVFDVSMHQQIREQLRLETELCRAIKEDEFRLQYQPIVSLSTGLITGFEALLRWEHPRRGLLLPCQFLPFAEQSDLILRISDWVLWEVCRKLSSCGPLFRTDPNTHISVNVPSQYVEKKNLVAEVINCLKKADVEPSHLALELTESQILTNSTLVSQTLSELNSSGIKTYIDDFGTGYSSLSYLADLPAYALKIDRSFIHLLDESEKKVTVVRAIISLAHNLGMQVIAEGVERSEELRCLQTMGCEQAQGYYLGRPVWLTAVNSLVERNHCAGDYLRT